MAEESLERLAQLAQDLQDLSRLDAGVLVPRPERTELAAAFAVVRDEYADGTVRLHERGLAEVPPVAADPTLLERVLANLVADAVDHGPSLRAGEAGRLFAPEVPSFVGSPHSPDSRMGVTLHLALAHGFAEAMGASLVPEDTPGGGLTMVLEFDALPD